MKYPLFLYIGTSNFGDEAEGSYFIIVIFFFGNLSLKIFKEFQ